MSDKCKQRFEIVQNGWKMSLLCNLPKGHDGPHEDTENWIITEHAIPFVEKKYLGIEQGGEA